MSNADFYARIPPIASLRDLDSPAYYRDVPDDWWIALTDVRGSTQAVQRGLYKAVNGIAAASITALLNTVPGVDLPFVFGGDGATILLPGVYEGPARAALAATRRLAREQFDFDLRVGLVPVLVVRAAGYALRVTRLELSPNYHQALFRGGGLSHAEKLLKDPQRGLRYLIPDDEPGEANFDGFECRWSEMRGPYEETISLIVVPTARDEAAQSATLAAAVREVEAIYGDREARHPVDEKRMHVSLDLRGYGVETAVRQSTQGWQARLQLMLYSLAGFLLWKYRSKIWDRYKRVVREATDHEKVDDALRMVVAGTVAQRERLRAALEARRQAGELVYGIHAAPYALMTCLVFDRFGRQVHFLDGANGGYALAALEMKQQLATLSTAQD